MNIQTLSNQVLAGVFALGLSFLSSSHASPLFDGTAADAWFIDSTTGQLQGYDLDKWVEQYNSADFPNIVLSNNNAILVNNLQNSSSPLSSLQPSISIAGIGKALSVGDKSSDLSLVPEGGTFDKTIAIDIRVNATLLNQGNYTLSWKVGVKALQSMDLNNLNAQNTQDGYYIKTIYLVEDGTYDTDIKLLTADGSLEESLSAKFTINAGADQLRRDTDGDGLPDIVELDIGLDPLSDDWDADLDGDGWKEVDTWLRKFCLNEVTKIPVADDDCLDSEGIPIDTDNDNWTDFDEILRGTNPEDLEPDGLEPEGSQTEVSQQKILRYKDYPSVSRLYEVEYQIDNGLLQAPASPELNWSEAGVVTINGKRLYDSNKLLSIGDILEAGLTVNQIAKRLTETRAALSLGLNQLPAMRLPASDSVVINVTHRFHPSSIENPNDIDNPIDIDSFDTSFDYKRIYKTWLPRKSDATPKTMLDEIGEGTWTTANEWREGFVAYLLPRLTLIENPTFNLESTLPINAIEAVLTKESFFQGLAKTQLFTSSTQPGDSQFSKSWEKSLRRFSDDYSLDQTVIEIENALNVGGVLEGYANWLETNFLATNAGTRSDNYIVKQFMNETSQADLLRQYQFRLVTLPNVKTAFADTISLLELAVDTDIDGLNNDQELNQAVDQLTLPWISDSDGDLISDGDDECRNDPLNLCSNNPVRPQLTVDFDFSVLEPAENMDVAIVGVRLNEMANEPVTITYQTLLSATDTAVDGADFTSVTGTVTIKAGQQTALIEIPILSDINDEEGNETFSFEIIQIDNAVVADDGIVVITLNDNTIVTPPLNAPLLTDAVAQTYTKDVAITPLSFTNNGGGELISCTVDNLPVGLVIGININATSCIINGTPTEIQATSLHTVTATNTTGSDTATVSIEVKEEEIPLEAPDLEDLSLQTFTRGIEIIPLRFVNNGGGEIINCNPEVVPAGLSVSITDDEESCEYTGTPTSIQLDTEHFLEASNDAGKSVATVHIEIIEDTSTDNTSPIASQFSPADGSENIELDTSISTIFNEDMYTQTITVESFTLKTILGDLVSSTVNFDAINNKATLVPNENLALLRSYTANLKPAITDLAGNDLADTSWQFMVKDGVWQESQIMATESIDVDSPQIAINTKGVIFALWEESNDVRGLWSNHLTEEGWTVPEKVDHANDGYPLFSKIAADASGNAIAVWRQSNPNQFDTIWSNSYTSEGWADAQMIDFGSGGGVSEPQIVMDDSGNAIAIWNQKLEPFGNVENIWVNHFDSSGWDEPQIIGTESFSRSPNIAMNSSGNAVAVWQIWDSVKSRYVIVSKNYNRIDGWGELTEIDLDEGLSYSPEISINEDGAAVAIWHQVGEEQNIWVNYLSTDSIWGTAVKLDNLVGDAQYPQVIIDDSGEALAVWQQKTGTVQNVYSSHLISLSDMNWGESELIGTSSESDLSNLFRPLIDVDKLGNAIAVWRGGDAIWSNRHTLDGWGEATKIFETEESQNKQQIVIDKESGKGLAIWKQNSVWNGNESDDRSYIITSEFK